MNLTVYRFASSRYPIRLASRLELAVVMSVVLRLLFLPVAGGNCRYWSIVGNAEDTAYALEVNGTVRVAVPGWYLRSEKNKFIRLASRLGLPVVMSVVFLLFLPAATHYWCSLSNYARVTEAISLYFYSASVAYWGRVVERQSRFGIRLASRQGCLVVRLVVLSLLFLPAAGQRTGGIVGNSNVWGRYVHPIASSNGMNGELRALVMWFNNPGIGSEGVAMREWGLSIRLASRLGLPVVMSVVFLLFLPAAPNLARFATLTCITGKVEDVSLMRVHGLYIASGGLEPGTAWQSPSVKSFNRLVSREYCLL